MASIRCEQCQARIGRWSFRKEVYIIEDQDKRRHYFCSTVCGDIWCNQKIDEGCIVKRAPLLTHQCSRVIHFPVRLYVS